MDCCERLAGQPICHLTLPGAQDQVHPVVGVMPQTFQILELLPDLSIGVRKEHAMLGRDFPAKGVFEDVIQLQHPIHRLGGRNVESNRGVFLVVQVFLQVNKQATSVRKDLSHQFLGLEQGFSQPPPLS